MIEFHLVAGNLALDFANTLDDRYVLGHPVELLPTYRHFLSFARQAGIITWAGERSLLDGTSEHQATRTLKRVIELRETLYFLFQSVAVGRAPKASDLRTLNRYLDEKRVPDAVVWRSPEFILSSRGLAGTPDGPLWPIIDAAVSLLTSPDRHNIRECGVDSCRWLFLDHTKNHSRRWCDMKVCGNRVKAARFQAKQHEG